MNEYPNLLGFLHDIDVVPLALDTVGHAEVCNTAFCLRSFGPECVSVRLSFSVPVALCVRPSVCLSATECRISHSATVFRSVPQNGVFHSRHATSVWQGCRVSLGISPVQWATQKCPLLLHPELGRNQPCSVYPSVGSSCS